MIHTKSGIMFDVVNPDPDKIKISDIASALSKDCRYGGHCRYFYSVAEHCILLSQLDLSLEEQRILLLHDASEAYLRDIPTDIKNLPQFSDYRILEDNLYQIIMKKFRLPINFPAHLKELDINIRVNEMKLLFDNFSTEWLNHLREWKQIPKLELKFWDSKTAELKYRIRCHELGLFDHPHTNN